MKIREVNVLVPIRQGRYFDEIESFFQFALKNLREGLSSEILKFILEREPDELDFKDLLFVYNDTVDKTEVIYNSYSLGEILFKSSGRWLQVDFIPYT